MTSVPEVEISQMTNVEFARRVGCHHTTASRYRNGERVPSTALAMRILDEFPLTSKQKDQLLRLMAAKGMSLDERRKTFGKWLRENVFSQPSQA
jgi:transcriptional regulator with XRE-family HTH domain